MANKSRKRRTVAVGAVEPPPSASSRRAAAAAERRPLPSGSAGGSGSLLGMAFGLGLLVLGVVGGLRSDPLPFPLVLALCVAGALEVVLCWRTLHRSRAAWSFALSLSGTAALVCIFGAPKLASAMGVSIQVAVVPALVAALVTYLLATAAGSMSSRS